MSDDGPIGIYVQSDAGDSGFDLPVSWYSLFWVEMPCLSRQLRRKEYIQKASPVDI